MKKNSTGIIVQVLFGILALALLIIGTIMFVSSFFIPSISLFNSITIIALGAILFFTIRMCFMFKDIVELMTTYLKEIKLENSPYTYKDKSRTSPLFNFDDNTVNKIMINADMSKEEIDELKEQYPLYSSIIENIIEQMKHHSPNFTRDCSSSVSHNYSKFTIEELTKKLNEAVELDKFEIAAEIRNEINKRKESK